MAIQVEPIEAALKRVVLCNQLREYGDLSMPVRIGDLDGKQTALAFITKLTQYIRKRRSKTLRLIVAPFIFEPVMMLLVRILLFHGKPTWGSAIRAVRGGIRAILKRIYFYESVSSDIHRFRSTSVYGRWSSRECVRLCALGRYGAAVEELADMFLAGCDQLEMRQWLGYFLEENGDIKAAEQIRNGAAGQHSDYDNKGSIASAWRERTCQADTASTTCGIVISSVADSAVFRSSINSILESDFTGRIIVVEDGLKEGKGCEDFCRGLPVEYAKLGYHGGPSECFNVGIESLGSNTELVVLAHNDVLWPKTWFGEVAAIWSENCNKEELGLLNLGYLQFNSNAELRELFVQRKYIDLSWVLRWLLKVRSLDKLVQDVQIEDKSKTFGLAFDPWNTDFDSCKAMVGRWSVAVSFPRKLWVDMGGFSPKVFLGDVELQDYCMKNKKFMLWANNAPLIHFRSADTNDMNADDFAKFKRMEEDSFTYAATKYGWNVDHFLAALFSDTYLKYYDEIIAAANKNGLSELDYVFEYFDGVLKGGRAS